MHTRIQDPCPDCFRVDSTIVEPTRNLFLPASGVAIQVEPRLINVLLALASRAGEVVPRDALIDAAWPDVAVSGNSLTQAISELRRALGDDPKTPRVIETIRKRGYRLVAPITPVKSVTPTRTHSARSRRSAASAPRRDGGRLFGAVFVAVVVVFATLRGTWGVPD